MISFKQPEERASSALILLSLVLLAGTLLYMVFVPPPSAAGVVKGRERSRQQLQKEVASLQTQTRQLEAQVRPRLWKGSSETIAAAVLAKVTAQANRQALKLTAFRPQRPQALEGMTELPYSIQLSGSYPVVRAMVAFLDAPQNRLVLRSVQIAATDTAVSAVTATIGVSAYTESAAPPTQKAVAKRG